MDVYLLPTGRNRHELYCEIADTSAEAVTQNSQPSAGWMHRQVARFRAMLAEAEAERDRTARGDEGEQRGGVGRWVMRKLAETIAEQRLLWHMRSVSRARLIHPADMPGDDAMAIARRQLGVDFSKHRRWCVIDSAITAVTGPVFFFIPGPNLISWLFAFRALGHYYALRGAQRAISTVDWSAEPSGDLTALREALALDAAVRYQRLEEIASSLGLSALAAFLERVARRPS